MENEQEKMQFLGLIGVYKESYKIMSSRSKIFTSITSILIYPLPFIFLIHIKLTDDLFDNILHHSRQITQTQFSTPQHQKLIETIFTEWAIFFLFNILHFISSLFFYLLSSSSVVYTVASIYTDRDITFHEVMSVVPKLLKRLMITFLCILVAGFVYNVITLIVATILSLTIGVQNYWIAIFVILYISGFIYLVMIWQLANVVAVLEDLHGFEAMRKSKELIQGKMGLFIIITLKFKVSLFVIQFLLRMVVADGWKLLELGLMNRLVIGFVCFYLLSHLFLWMHVIQTVLYFVCKSYHHQKVDKFDLLDQLIVYLDEYEPLKIKDVQLEYCHV